MVSNFGISFIFLFAVALLASPIDGRKGPGEYWGKVMEEQPMPETVKAFVNQGPYEVKEKTEAVKDITADFDSTPDATIIYDGVNPTEMKTQNDFDTTPDETIIYDNVKPTKVETQISINNFDATPDVTIVYNDVKPAKVGAKKEDCSTTHDDGLASKKLLVDDFEPRPNISVYNN